MKYPNLVHQKNEKEKAFPNSVIFPEAIMKLNQIKFNSLSFYFLIIMIICNVIFKKHV